jgi:hypothetical protein
MSDIVTYAIGDVHGEAERLARLHERIFADIAGHGVRARVIHLGDLVDRGPESRACVTRAMAMEEADDDIEAITLMGNHEEMMIKAVALGFVSCNMSIWNPRDFFSSGKESYLHSPWNILDFVITIILMIRSLYLHWPLGCP